MKAITECESEHRALRKETILENRYQIERVLGEGGFGITYEGRQLLHRHYKPHPWLYL